MKTTSKELTRRRFVGTVASAVAFPYIIPASALGMEDRPSPSNRITLGCIGMGNRGNADMNAAMGFSEVQVVAICDVGASKCEAAKARVDGKYDNKDCAAYSDFREITRCGDIDAVLIATPDHWHAVISIDAMRNGKDVFCEKPETLTIREGRIMGETVHRYARVFSGGSQRVWGDYNWLHKMVWGGRIGEVEEVWVDCGDPSKECYLPAEPVPEGLDWDLWLGPAPWAPFNKARLKYRPWRDYSGGGMTDWGCHGFGGALFCCGLPRTGAVEIIPPDGKDVERLTYKFANGVRFYHGGGWGGMISIRGSKGETPKRGVDKRSRQAPPDIHIPNYKGRGGIFGDFIHCVRTREEPFRDIETVHRTATHCHLGNIAYWLKRPLKWDPEKEKFINDPEANRWLERPKRGQWGLF